METKLFLNMIQLVYILLFKENLTNLSEESIKHFEDSYNTCCQHIFKDFNLDFNYITKDDVLEIVRVIIARFGYGMAHEDKLVYTYIKDILSKYTSN